MQLQELESKIKASLDDFSTQEDVQQLIMAAKLGKKTLHEIVRDILVERRIMEKNKDERYILSDAGKYFFKQLFAQDEIDKGLI